MNSIQKKRLTLLILFLFGLLLATSFILYALKQNLNVFLTPNQINTATLPADYTFRLGGMVKKESVKHDREGLGVNFIVTDFHRELPVRFVGVLPDLFHEGKGVIAEGKLLPSGVFLASNVLAKHDENYMPKNVSDAMNPSQQKGAP